MSQTVYERFTNEGLTQEGEIRRLESSNALLARKAEAYERALDHIANERWPIELPNKYQAAIDLAQRALEAVKGEIIHVNSGSSERVLHDEIRLPNLAEGINLSDRSDRGVCVPRTRGRRAGVYREV